MQDRGDPKAFSVPLRQGQTGSAIYVLWDLPIKTQDSGAILQVGESDAAFFTGGSQDLL